MSVEAEMSALGAIFLDADYTPDFVNALEPEMFTHETTRKIFQAITDLYWDGKRVDTVTVMGALPDEKVNIVRLAQYVPAISHINDYIRIIQDDWLNSKICAKLTEINFSSKKPEETLDRLRELVTETEKAMFFRNDKGLTSFNQAAEELRTWLRNTNDPDTIHCGFDCIDRATGGFMKKTVFGLAARPGCGKTDFAINLALKLMKRGGKVLYFTMEMSKLQLMQRVVSNLLNINGERIRDRKLDDRELRQVDSILAGFTDAERLSFVEEPNLSVRRVRHFIDLWKPDVVFIDHIGLMKRPNIKEQYKAIGMVSNQLKQLALEKDVALVELVQMNRRIENSSGKKPNMSDLRESGDIEQDCDNIAFLVPEDLKNKNLSGNNSAETILYLEKSRHGRTGAYTFHWRPQHHSFTEVENKYG